MSHVAKVEGEVKDLDCFEVAVEKLGGELRRDQRTFQAWGASQPCLHAVAVKGARKGAYEIGLRLKDASDPTTFELACDFFDGSLRNQFGEELVNLRSEYLAVVAERMAARRGYRTQRVVDERARIHVRAIQ